MTNGQKAEAISKFIDEAAQPFLTAHRDVVRVEYRYDGANHGYVKVTTAFGFSNYDDVTDLDCGSICLMLCAMMVNGRPKRLIEDREIKRTVEELFAK